MSNQPDPIREIRTELINHADPIVRQAYEYIVDLELEHAQQKHDLEAEVERQKAHGQLQARLARQAAHETERLREALTNLLDANATREHEGLPREEWDAIILAAEEALDRAFEEEA